MSSRWLSLLAQVVAVIAATTTQLGASSRYFRYLNAQTAAAGLWSVSAARVQPALAGLKHLNRLEQVLARAEWSDPAVVEGLMCDTDGRLIEGTATNLFLVADNRVVTAALDRCSVAGVMRRLLIDEHPGYDLPVDIRDVALDELIRADECFLTNAVIGVWPVIQVLGLGDIGSRPGRIALDIRAALEARFGFSGSH